MRKKGFQLGGPGLAQAGMEPLPGFWLVFAFVDTVRTIFSVSIIHLRSEGLSAAGPSGDFLPLVFTLAAISDLFYPEYPECITSV